MSPRRRRPSLLFLLCLLALCPATCADAPPPPPVVAVPAAGPATPSPLPPLPRSSIAAVLAHRGELDLSEEQVRALEERDQEREKEDAALRDELEKKKQAQAAKASAPNGGGPGGGGRMRGGGMGGKFKGPPGAGAVVPGHEESLEDRVDADDTKAYLDIEELLNEGQREQAREIASDYRAKLYERREATRAR